MAGCFDQVSCLQPNITSPSSVRHFSNKFAKMADSTSSVRVHSLPSLFKKSANSAVFTIENLLAPSSNSPAVKTTPVHSPTSESASVPSLAQMRDHLNSSPYLSALPPSLPNLALPDPSYAYNYFGKTQFTLKEFKVGVLTEKCCRPTTDTCGGLLSERTSVQRGV